MATVVHPRENPWNKLPQAIESLMAPLVEMKQKELWEKNDVPVFQAASTTLQAAGNDPQQQQLIFSEMAGKVKSDQGKALISKALFENMARQMQPGTTLVDRSGNALKTFPAGQNIQVTPEVKTEKYVDPKSGRIYDVPNNTDPPAGTVNLDIWKQQQTEDRFNRSQENVASRQDKSLAALAERQANKPEPAVEDKRKYRDIVQRMSLSKPVSSEEKAWMQAYEKEAQLGPLARGEGYASFKPMNFIDTKNNNRIVTISQTEALKANQTEPGRYIETTAAAPTQALTRTALIEDIRGNVEGTRTAIKGLKTDFDEKTRLQLYKAIQSTDPTGALNNLISGEFGKSLTSDQQQYLVDVNLLIENAMAMRSVLGAGQGSEDLRRAIKATIPSTGTFSKEYANKQLDSFEKVLDRLEKGVPDVPLRGRTLGASQPNAGQPTLQDIDAELQRRGGM